jgi:hypothetical protein
MTSNSEVSVTMSAELLMHLRHRAADKDIPLDFFIAGLICDTIESFCQRLSRAGGRGFHACAVCVEWNGSARERTVRSATPTRSPFDDKRATDLTQLLLSNQDRPGGEMPALMSVPALSTRKDPPRDLIRCSKFARLFWYALSVLGSFAVRKTRDL